MREAIDICGASPIDEKKMLFRMKSISAGSWFTEKKSKNSQRI